MIQCPYCKEYITSNFVTVKSATRRDPPEAGIFPCPFCDKRIRLVRDDRLVRWIQMGSILPLVLSFDLYTGSRTRDIHGIGYICAAILVAWGMLILLMVFYSQPSVSGVEPSATPSKPRDRHETDHG